MITNSYLKPVEFSIPSQMKTMLDGFLYVTIMGFCIIFTIYTHPDGDNKIPEHFTIYAVIASTLLAISIILRVFADERILIDPVKRHVLQVSKFMFFKRSSYLCLFDEIIAVKLYVSQDLRKGRVYNDYYIQIVIPDKRIKSSRFLRYRDEDVYQFNTSIGKLRDKTLEIAEITGLKVTYDEKIPPEERLQPEAG